MIHNTNSETRYVEGMQEEMWKKNYIKYKEMAEIPEEKKKYRIIYFERPFQETETDYYATVEKSLNVMALDGWEVIDMRNVNNATLIVFQR